MSKPTSLMIFFYVWRQGFPHGLQHLETTSTLESLQCKSLAHYSMTKIPCPKKLFSHAKKKITCQKNFPMTKIFFITKNHAPKKFNAPQQKKSMPHQNFTSIKNFHMSTHNYLFVSYNHTQQKISYMSKIAIKNKIPTCPCPCTNEFSHIQNPSHKIFHYQKSHTQQNFSITKVSCP